MDLNHWYEKSSGSKRMLDKDFTLSTIRSILAADERLRIKASSYLTGRDEDTVIDIFPTTQTLSYIRLLHGFIGTCRGKSIHQVLRDPCVLRKQLLYGLCKTIFDTITVKQVANEWKIHSTLFPYNALDDEHLEQYLMVWSSSVRQSVQTGVLGALRDILYQFADNDEYGLYVDWYVTVGIIPLMDVKSKPADITQRAAFVRAAIHKSTETHPLAQDLLTANLPLLQQVVTHLCAVRIVNSPELRIFKRIRSEKIEAQLKEKHTGSYIVTEPLAYERDQLFFTTPIAHLHEEILRYDSLCRHQKICQLLNTYPVKAVTTSRHEMNCKKIVDMMEKHDRGSDAKKSIIKFLLNVSDSKSRIGIEDSVESFLQDLTPSLVDQSRLMPSRTPGGGPSAPGGISAAGPSQDRDIRDLFKKQMIKCLEEQIQAQVDEIQDLKSINQTWESRVRELRDLLTRYARQRSGRTLERDPKLHHLSVTEAIRKAQEVSFTPLAVEDNRVVANSFFSQFIPNTEKLENLLTELWENEYFRTFRMKRIVTAQGAEEAIVYSNYTVERVTLPYLFSILSLSTLEPIPEDYLNLSFGEIVAAAYDDSKFRQYVDLICNREKARRRQMTTQPDAHRPSNAERPGQQDAAATGGGPYRLLHQQHGHHSGHSHGHPYGARGFGSPY
ncbi:capsid portal protein [Cercopithecine betaherpesvirus 5]|uniref:Capsid portal protein n=1 Tax=Simian cytomegalovirus (strain Colburn) TaxID=50292 RepID=G8XTG5_SCMVC|nr:capsid portal protein [Cercopithecine betaherpesvirus 5]AEV80457.1 capsid portal protein [Cercopithecine betaherpesvirus 5]